MRTLKKIQMFHPVVPKTWIMAFGLLVMICVGAGVWAKPTPSQPLRMQIPILGTSLDRHRSPMGLVSNIVIDLFKR
ncbi:MAG: hypothetical protein VST69_09165, partial [Nitrospirota bacterium]|nr:hypothetical protein [Nitrospirota bacterium]